MVAIPRLHKPRWGGAALCIGIFTLSAIYFFGFRAKALPTLVGGRFATSDSFKYHRRLDSSTRLLQHSDVHAMNYNESRDSEDRVVLPTIFVVTPTYTRAVQKAELTHMCNVLRHVKNVFWIVVEDSTNRTDPVKSLLSNCKIPSVHMNVKSVIHPELTIVQRKLALDWLRLKVRVSRDPGVLYFADDDNTYDPRIFEEMRYTKKVSVWPVGLVSGAPVEAPLVENGKVVDWFSVSNYPRRFVLDMAGFAINVKLLLDFPNANFDYNMTDGWLESEFLERFNITLEDLEPKAKNCTEMAGEVPRPDVCGAWLIHVAMFRAA